MDRIKVIEITQSVSGVETYLKLMATNIDKTKFEIIFASSESSYEAFCNEQGLKFYKLPLSRSFNPFTDISSFLAIRKVIKKEKPNLVHLHTAKGGFLGRIAAKMTSCKSLFTPHGGAYLSFTGLKRMVFFLLELIGKKFTYKMLAVSQSEANRFIYEVGIKAEDIFVIPNALTIPEHPEVVPDKLGKLEGDIKIGTISRITYQKNPLLFADIVYDVIRKYPNAHFYILGAGFHDHLRKELDEKIAAIGIGNNLHLIEKGDSVIALNFLRQLDMFLLPSVYEGLPYSLLEAMLQEVPSIVSKCDGNNDVINNNENGFSCLTRDEYVSVIFSLIEDKEKARRIAIAAKKYVIEKHDIKVNIKMLEKIYAEI